ncbi:hypothetical protein C8R45DRAFT_934680 [Mycena sanguinolenta]|nr:hypothetical protein C8R45DRAFT_934680 [Mycena sanguinolenta]
MRKERQAVACGLYFANGKLCKDGSNLGRWGMILLLVLAALTLRARLRLTFFCLEDCKIAATAILAQGMGDESVLLGEYQGQVEIFSTKHQLRGFVRELDLQQAVRPRTAQFLLGCNSLFADALLPQGNDTYDKPILCTVLTGNTVHSNLTDALLLCHSTPEAHTKRAASQICRAESHSNINPQAGGRKGSLHELAIKGTF